MRQESTGKVMCNFYVYGEGLCTLGKMEQNENSWRWTCWDQSDDVAAATMFAIRFTKKEHVAEYQKVFEGGYADNMKLKWGEAPADKTEAEPVEAKAEEKKDEAPVEAKAEEKSE